MRLLIDILHPAHVHFFKNFIWEMEKKGHKVLITTRNKDITLDLLKEYNLKYKQISRVKRGTLWMLWELLLRNIKFYRIARKFRADVLLGEMGSTIAMMGKILRVPSVVFWDTEISVLSNLVSYPLATAVYTPECYEGKVHGNHVMYAGYQELAYLHPNRFTPDKAILKKYGIKGKYAVVRFVSWTSNHDKKHYGFKEKRELVKRLAKHGKVCITSEEKLPADLQRYQLDIHYKDIHHVLAFADLYIGESATMATEAALLGTPSLYVATSGRGYINELEKRFQIVEWFKEENKAIERAERILKERQSKQRWQQKRDKLLQKKIDVTGYMMKLIENKAYLKKRK